MDTPEIPRTVVVHDAKTHMVQVDTQRLESLKPHANLISVVWREVSELVRVTDSRLVVWRGAGATFGILALMTISTFIYCRFHNYNPFVFFEQGEYKFPSFEFVNASSFVQIAVEIGYWSSIGVLIRRLSICHKNAQRANFDLIAYFNDVITEWLTLPVIAVFSILVLKVFAIRLGAGFDFSDGKVTIEFTIALGFMLGFFGSRDAVQVLRSVRDRIANITMKKPLRRSKSTSKRESKTSK